jgi:regulator of ribonuclease activity A
MRLSIHYLKSPFFIYILKCLSGLSIGYWLFISFPHHQFYWTIISILIVISPDPKDSTRLALDRMKANTIGSITGLLMFLINQPGLLLMAVGVVITIAICSLLKLMSVGRSALVALLIVMIHEKNGNSWEIALERMGCVIAGCVIALVITIIFDYFTREKQKPSNMEYKTTDLCDAHPDMVMIAEPIGFKDYGGKKKFSGMIHTVKCYEDHSWVEKALNTNGTGKVLVVDGGGSMRCAITGDRLAGIGLKNKWSGIIVYGCIRDSLNIAQLSIGVKALNTYPISRVTNTQWQENIPVRFAGVTFTPGQFVYCDEDGIITSEIALIV